CRIDSFLGETPHPTSSGVHTLESWSLRSAAACGYPGDVTLASQDPEFLVGGVSRRRPNSFHCVSSTVSGAPVSGSPPLAVFGKAMISRSEDAPVSSITRRSRPNATPPWG